MKKNNTILIVDGSGRGSALVDAYGKSKHVKKIIAIPGNDLMQINTKKKVTTYQAIKTTDVEKIIDICRKEKVTFVDVAQDDAVEAGVADATLALGIPTVGPTKNAGRIEWDKAWSREFMKKYNIAHPQFYVFHSEPEGVAFLEKQKNQSWFVKASGLVGGKGALPAKNNDEAKERIKEVQKFGKAGKTYLLEQWLIGEEFSMFAVSDGKTVKIIGSAQDHKRMYTFDLGENTGGMGCSTPPLIVNSDIQKQAEAIIAKTIQGLSKEGHVYKGILYVGGIVVNGKVFVIEFNARWGSPEAEVLVPGIKTDMYELGMAVYSQTLHKIKVVTDKKSRVVVTAALQPGKNTKNGNRQLFGLDKVLKIKNVTVYGTRVLSVGKKMYVSEGRLFQLVAEGKNVVEARQNAYAAMSQLFIEGNNLHYRTDIGWRDVERYWQKSR
jgi:phosphoribosylamine--glycine ligase